MTSNYAQMFDTVVAHAAETYTGNFRDMDAEQSEEAIKTVRDKATNAYQDGMTDIEWLNATLVALGCDKDASAPSLARTRKPMTKAEEAALLREIMQ